MSDPSTVDYLVEGPVASIVLARPEASNSVDLPTARAFSDAVDAAAADDSVRVIVLAGQGKRFCAGGDLGWVATQADTEAALLELAQVLDGALQRLARVPKPVVASVRGAVAGAGLGVILTADVVVAAEGTKFLAAYADAGLTPDCGVSWLLPRAVGQQRALDLALTGRVLTAAEAQEWGLIARVVPDDALATVTDEIVARFTDRSTYALGHARRLIREAFETSRADSGADESRTIAAGSLTAEAKAAMARFVRA